MTNSRINDEQVVELATEGFSNYKIAEILNCDEASVRRALKRMNYVRHLLPVDLDSRFHVNLDTPIVLKDVDAIVTADWHIPLYDPHYVNEMISTAREHNIRTLVIAGDFFNFDALSAYDPKQEEAHLEREYKEGLAVMRTLTETFDRIVYVWGNHDARLHKALGFAMKFREAMKMVFGALGSEIMAKLEFTNLDHVWFEFSNAAPDRDRWYVCHPQSYSRIPLSTARTLTSKVNANVITAHSHHCAIGYGVDGRKVAVEAGGLFDRQKTAYLQRSTTFPTWQQGYGYFIGGRFYLTSPDWQAA